MFFQVWDWKIKGNRRTIKGNKRKLKGNRREIKGTKRKIKGNKRVIKGGKRKIKGGKRKIKGSKRNKEENLKAFSGKSCFLESYHHKNISISSLKSYQKSAKNNPAKGVAHKTPKISQPFTII